MNIEILRNTLYKAYLDDFAHFCSTLGGATAEIMGDLLAFEVCSRRRPGILYQCHICCAVQGLPGRLCALLQHPGRGDGRDHGRPAGLLGTPPESQAAWHVILVH